MSLLKQLFLAICLFLVVAFNLALAGLVIYLVIEMRRKPQATQQGKWAPGPNAGWKQMGEQTSPALEASASPLLKGDGTALEKLIDLMVFERLIQMDARQDGARRASIPANVPDDYEDLWN